MRPGPARSKRVMTVALCRPTGTNWCSTTRMPASAASVSASTSPPAMSRVSSGLGNLGGGEPAIGQADGGLGPGTAKRRAGTEEEAQVRRRVGLGVNRVGGAQQGLQAYQRREPTGADSQKRAGGIEAETQCPQSRGVIKREHIVNVSIRLMGEHLLADGALDKDSAPAIRAAILDGTK